MTLALRYAVRSDVGLVREGNEDSGLGTPHIVAIADGMGGHAAGEVASSLTIQALSALDQPVGAQDGAAFDALAGALRDANDRIQAATRDDPRREGMGTTVTAVLLTGGDLALAHIGDSRGYLLRDGELRQITKDHTYVQGLVDEGKLTPEQASSHPARSLILRALDGRTDLEPDLEMLGGRAGDRLLLCSDGLSDVVASPTLRETLVEQPDRGAAAERLIELALAAGGPDNITVVVADVVDAGGTDSSGTEGAEHADGAATTVVVGAAADPGSLTTEPSPPTGPTRRAIDDTDPELSPIDEEDLRYAPRAPQRFAWLRRTAFALAAVGAVVLTGYLAYGWSQQQYFVGDNAGAVAVYRGLSQSVGSIDVNDVEEVAEGLPTEALPAVYREQVESSIAADDLADARSIVDRLRRVACDAQPEPTPTPSPTPAPAPAPAPAPTQTPTPSPTPGPDPVTGLDCSTTGTAS